MRSNVKVQPPKVAFGTTHRGNLWPQRLALALSASRCIARIGSPSWHSDSHPGCPHRPVFAVRVLAPATKAPNGSRVRWPAFLGAATGSPID